MEAYIYTYVNKETKKTYIGARCAYVGSCYDDFNIKYFSSSKDKEFLKDMADGKLEGQIVLVMNDDNADKKIFEVEAKMIQAYWDKYGKENSYNHYANGNWSTAGTHLSDETKAKIGAASKGRISPMKGKTVSEETKYKISASNKGRIPGMIGKHHSEETKSKISIAKKGRHQSEEARAKMSASRKGRISPMKGKTPWNKGKHHSDETRKKISAKAKERTSFLKGKKQKKFNYLTENGDIVMIDKTNARRWHPDWVKID